MERKYDEIATFRYGNIMDYSLTDEKKTVYNKSVMYVNRRQS